MSSDPVSLTNEFIPANCRRDEGASKIRTVMKLRAWRGDGKCWPLNCLRNHSQATVRQRRGKGCKRVSWRSYNAAYHYLILSQMPCALELEHACEKWCVAGYLALQLPHHLVRIIYNTESSIKINQAGCKNLMRCGTHVVTCVVLQCRWRNARFTIPRLCTQLQNTKAMTINFKSEISFSAYKLNLLWL